MSADVKAGETTTEYAVAKSAGVWGVVGMLLGAVVMFGPIVMDKLTGVVAADSPVYLIAGAGVSVASILYKLLVDVGYIKSRTDVKVSAAQASATVSTDPELPQ